MTKENKKLVSELVNIIGKTNDKLAMEKLLELMEQVVIKFLTRYSCDVNMIRDITADTFVVVAEKAGTRESDKNSYSWILTIAKNLYYNERRRLNRLTDINIVSPIESVMSYAFNADFFIDFNTALEKLTYDERQIYYLKFECNYKVYQIAKIMVMSVATIKRRLQIIRHIMKEVVKGE